MKKSELKNSFGLSSIEKSQPKSSSKKYRESNSVLIYISALPLPSLQEVAQQHTGDKTAPTPSTSTSKKTPAAALGKPPSEKGMSTRVV